MGERGGRTGGKVLVSDFDGTMTQKDFFQLVRERLVPPGTPDFWQEYVAGWLTHFEAIRDTLAAGRATERELEDLARSMGLEPDLKANVEMLCAKGWRVVVASAGCKWYIERLLDWAGVAGLIEVHANPGRYDNGRLWMERPDPGARDYSYEVGVDKTAVVRDALAEVGPGNVAFAGDGWPDVAPALLVRPELRFARRNLAEALRANGEGFRAFERWGEVACGLVGGPQEG